MKNQTALQSIFKRFWRTQESGILVITILFMITINIINPTFITFSNIVNIIRSTGFVLITAIGMTFVLITGGLDLSVGSVLGLGGVICGLCLLAGIPIVLSILIAIAAGVVIGLFNAFMVVKVNIPPLIVTLSMLYMARGIVYIITEGAPVYPLPMEFQMIEQSDLWGIPTIVVISLVLVAIGEILLRKTVLGRSIYAVGGNSETAKLCGINSNLVKYFVYAATAGLAAFTGALMASRLGSAQSGAGTGFELQTIAAAIIGGTSTFGGTGTVIGTCIGALFMSILSNSMTLLKISAYWQNLAIGAILLLAVVLDQMKRRKAIL